MDALRVEGLTKRYGETLALDRLGFALAPGRTLGLLGGNGAGKTTTIAMLLGLLIPTAGSIQVLGRDMARDRFAALARMNFSSPYVSLPARLSVRARRGGERLRPRIGRGSRTLKALLQEARVPRAERARLPLVFAAEHLLAVADLWSDASIHAHAGSTRRAHLRWRRP